MEDTPVQDATVQSAFKSFNALFGNIVKLAHIESDLNPQQFLVEENEISACQRREVESLAKALDDMKNQMESFQRSAQSEAKKCSTLQRYYLNELKMSANLQKQVEELGSKISGTKRKAEESAPAEEDEEEEDDEDANQKISQSSSSGSAVSSSFDALAIKKYYEAVDSVKDIVVEVDDTTPVTELLHRYVCRIFDGGSTFYGVIVSYKRPFFLVVYEDGDSQRLSEHEVRVSLVDVEGVPELSKRTASCLRHVKARRFDEKGNLPPK